MRSGLPVESDAVATCEEAISKILSVFGRVQQLLAIKAIDLNAELGIETTYDLVLVGESGSPTHQGDRVIEGHVDASFDSGTSVTWWIDVHRQNTTAWRVERSLRVDNSPVRILPSRNLTGSIELSASLIELVEELLQLPPPGNLPETDRA